MALVDLETMRRFVNHVYGPEVAAVLKDSDLREYGDRGRGVPPRMRNAILRIGSKR